MTLQCWCKNRIDHLNKTLFPNAHDSPMHLAFTKPTQPECPPPNFTQWLDMKFFIMLIYNSMTFIFTNNYSSCLFSTMDYCQYTETNDLKMSPLNISLQFLFPCTLFTILPNFQTASPPRGKSKQLSVVSLYNKMSLLSFSLNFLPLSPMSFSYSIFLPVLFFCLFVFLSGWCSQLRITDLFIAQYSHYVTPFHSCNYFSTANCSSLLSSPISIQAFHHLPRGLSSSAFPFSYWSCISS